MSTDYQQKYEDLGYKVWDLMRELCDKGENQTDEDRILINKLAEMTPTQCISF